ncbi:MAG TPA: hypothetical protein VLJ38_20625 [Polyangiaceae bacterium]|nr:hypothetical protein [Polyangiaceae bacterium]
MRPNYPVSSLAALVIACGATSSESAKERANQLASQSEAESQSCLEATSSSGWVSGGVGSAPSRFSLELDATPSTSGEDALFGLAHVSPSAYSDLAAIVRFNDAGKIDARDGDVYRAVTDVAYEPGVPQHLTFQVDTYARTYSLLARRDSQGGYVASDFKYRSEQANADGLAYFGMKVDGGGPLDVCNVKLVDQSCTPADETDGFVNLAFPSQGTFVTVSFDATPNGSNLDSVFGVSAGAARSFDDIAAAVRFNPDGRIDARDGSAYREINSSLPAYVAGQTYHFDLLLDVLGHAYTVVINGSVVGHNFAFRTSQAQVATLGNFVIESDSGGVTSCGFGFVPARDAVYLHSMPVPTHTVPLSDGRFLDYDASKTVVYDSRGLANGTLTLAGPAPADVAMAADAAGNVYRLGNFSGTVDYGAGPLTSAGGVDAYVVKYDAAFKPVWSKNIGGPTDDVPSTWTLNVNARGDVSFVVRDDQLVRLDAQGNVVYESIKVPPDTELALDPSGNVFTTDDPPADRALSITKRDENGNVVWTQHLPVVRGGADIERLAADATGGVVFAGEIQGGFAFPDGSTFTFDAGENGPQTYVAKLDANGARVYARATEISYFEGLTVDGLGNAAVSGTHVNPFIPRVEEYGPTGALVREVSTADLLGLPDLGSGSAVKADAAGDLYWAFWPGVATDYGAFFVKLHSP